MREGWKRYKIEDLGRIITGKTPSTQNPENFGTKYPFITPKDMVGRKRIFQTERYLSEEGKNAVKNCLLPPNSVCVSCIGSDMGKVVMTTKSSVTNQQLNSIVCSHVFDSDFVYYAVTNISELLKNAGHHSTAVPILNKSDFSNFEIDAPDLPFQHRIAAILSALDDKIELNRQTNQTLEAIAQTIFKEWFVDFRFPHSPLEGWQAKPDGVESSPFEGCPKGGVDAFLRPCPTGKVDSLHAKPVSLPSWQKNSLFPFWTLPKNHTLQERAKELRKQGILSEVVFWKAFKDKKKLGWDIDRQVIIGNFIVDFFIPELGLVFEIDGSSHNDKQEYDQERDAFLSSLQLKVVRISDKDVLRNIEGVWSFVTESIKDRVEVLSPPRPSGTPQEGKSPPRQASPATPQEGKSPPRQASPATPQEGKNPPRQASPATPQEGNKCEMQDSELGLIPKGWRVGKLGEIVELNPKLAIKKGSNSEYVEMKDISETSASILNHRKREFASGSKFQNGDTLLARITPCLENGKTGFVDFLPKDEIGWGFTEFIVLRAAQSISPYFIYCLSRYGPFREFAIQSMVGSSGRQRVVESILTEFPVVIGGEEVHKKFTKLAKPIFEEIKRNSEQSATLAALRDLLLPKLMNGEIEV